MKTRRLQLGPVFMHIKTIVIRIIILPRIHEQIILYVVLNS